MITNDTKIQQHFVQSPPTNPTISKEGCFNILPNLNIHQSWARTVSAQYVPYTSEGGSFRRQTKPHSSVWDSLRHIYAWSHSANKAGAKKTGKMDPDGWIVSFMRLCAFQGQLVGKTEKSSLTSRPWDWVRSTRVLPTVGSHSADQKESIWVLVCKSMWTHGELGNWWIGESVWDLWGDDGDVKKTCFEPIVNTLCLVRPLWGGKQALNPLWTEINAVKLS